MAGVDCWTYGISWYKGPSEGESFTVDVPADGWYCLAVWKNGAADLARAAKVSPKIYDLHGAVVRVLAGEYRTALKMVMMK